MPTSERGKVSGLVWRQDLYHPSGWFTLLVLCDVESELRDCLATQAGGKGHEMSFEETLTDIVRKAVRDELAGHSNDIQLLTADEVTELLGYSDRHAVYKLRREGQLKAVNLGDKTIRFSREEVRRFIQERTA